MRLLNRTTDLIIAWTLAIGTMAYAQEPGKPVSPNVTPLMQMKLEKSKAIIEGLAMENYDQISSNANMLKLLSLESGWNVIQTEEFITQSREFRRAADMIIQGAEKKDISRATLGYVALTVRCVECHTYMRQYRSEGKQPVSE